MKCKNLLVLLFVIVVNPLVAQIDSLDIKIGQMVIVGMPGTSVSNNSPIVQHIKEGLVGGILFFEYNIHPQNSIPTFHKLCTDLQHASSIPLFLSIDQEGGKVNRLKTKYGFPAMPSAKQVGLRNNIEYTGNVGDTIARSVASCALNVNYAPVVDLHNANCPVLGKMNRCYSSSPKEIIKHASLTIRAHRKYNIITCLKHFPGHGSSNTDSHLGLTDVTQSWQQSELQPYKTLIETDLADMIMVGHIVNRQLDAEGLPATLSKKMVTDILRKEYQYDGIIITDDMQMHAITNYYGLEKSIAKAINAGIDIVMFSNNIKGSKDYSPKNIHSTIKRLVKNGTIPESRIQESYERVMRYKGKME